MKALVTGGAGFIGSNVVAMLLEGGHDVRILDNLSSGYRRNVPPSVQLLESDVRDAAAVDEAVRGVEVVFHLAASVGNKRAIDFPIDDSMINVIGTLNVLEAMRRHHVRKIVASSSAGIFGELKILPIREDHPIEPDSPYGVSKLAEEKHALAYAKLHEIEAVCLRYFNVYGVYQRFDMYGNVIPIFATKLLRGEAITIFGDGEQTRDFVNVRDVARANLAAAGAAGLSGAFNIGSGTAISINALARTLVRLNGGRGEIQYAPPRKGDVRDSTAEIAAARRAFGYSPSVELGEGLEEYFAWLKRDLESERA